MLNIFKAKPISLQFDNSDALHKFECIVLVDNYVSSNIRRDGCIAITACEDGKCKATYPIKWDMVDEFRDMVKLINYYFNDIAKIM